MSHLIFLRESQKPQPGDKNTAKANKSFSFSELNTPIVVIDYTSVLYSMTKSSPRDLESDHLMAVFVNVWESLISAYSCRDLAASLPVCPFLRIAPRFSRMCFPYQII